MTPWLYDRTRLSMPISRASLLTGKGGIRLQIERKTLNLLLIGLVAVLGWEYFFVPSL